jgi:hypothetical protein
MGEKPRKEHKKTERSRDYTLLLSIFTNLTYERWRITFRDAHQKPLTSYGPLHDVQPERDGHSWWPFSHGNRACSRDGDCGVEMFSSLLYTFIFCYDSNDLGCKSTHFF